MSKDSIKLVKDYRCPECKCMSDMPITLIEQSPAELVHQAAQYSEPHYSWVEIHKCFNCETLYKFKNAT